MKTMFVAAVGVIATAAAAVAIMPEETVRLAGAAQVVRGIDGTIPSDIWREARCVAVIPESGSGRTPAGTSGSTGAAGDKVVVDRDQLLRLRDQLDALVLALNARR
jgi:hypothetical protein